jgi:hypothetical protein
MKKMMTLYREFTGFISLRSCAAVLLATAAADAQ